MNVLQKFRESFPRDRVFDFLIEEPEQDPDLDIRHGYLLYVENITVSFDGFKALSKLDLYINDGELRCIIGPNGAGKTTLMDVITGKTRPEKGSVFFGQNIDLLRLKEPEIVKAGIGRKFQKPTVFQEHTVFENLELAMHAEKSVRHSLFKGLTAEQTDRIDEVLGFLGLNDNHKNLAGLLSHGQKQWLEIGMLLVQKPKLLLLDEPVAGMTGEETERTAGLLADLAGEHSVVVVDHDMDFIRSIAQTVTVMHEGQVLAEGPMHRIKEDPKVIEVYLGE